jgi:hypothetical protein
MAWVMIAACAQELRQFNQAQYALNKAIEIDDSQTLAYQVSFNDHDAYVIYLFVH